MKNDDACCLRLFDALPDLLTFAKRQSDFWKLLWPMNYHHLQNKFREQHRQRGTAFRYSRQVPRVYSCERCAEQFREIHFLIENPHGNSEETRKLFLKESQIHAIRIHGGSFTQIQQAFFRGMCEPAD